MGSLIPSDLTASYRAPLFDVFWTFARPFQIYVESQKATISTSMEYSRFGQHDQNAAIDAENVAEVPQVYTVTGCILYENKQPWTYISPGRVGDLKLRESDGKVRIKVEASGYALLKECKLVNLDGFNFQLNSNARPHGLLGAPTRWSFTLEKTD